VLTLLIAEIPGSDKVSLGSLLALLFVGLTDAPLFLVACGGVISR